MPWPRTAARGTDDYEDSLPVTAGGPGSPYRRAVTGRPLKTAEK